MLLFTIIIFFSTCPHQTSTYYTSLESLLNVHSKNLSGKFISDPSKKLRPIKHEANNFSILKFFLAKPVVDFMTNLLGSKAHWGHLKSTSEQKFLIDSKCSFEFI
jgi:hypothetical protein